MYTFVFDMDGTLLSTEEIWNRAWIEANDRFKLKFDKDFIKTFIGMPKQNFELTVKPLIKYDGDYHEILTFRREYFYKYVDKNGIKIKPGVIRLLEHLKNNGNKIALCTSTFEDDVLKWLKMTDLYKFFDVIVTGDEIKNGKPDPEIYLKTLEKLGESADNCFAFEDSEYGIKSATSAGIKTYYIKDINDISDDVRKLIYKELKQIDELID